MSTSKGRRHELDMEVSTTQISVAAYSPDDNHSTAFRLYQTRGTSCTQASQMRATLRLATGTRLVVRELCHPDVKHLKKFRARRCCRRGETEHCWTSRVICHQDAPQEQHLCAKGTIGYLQAMYFPPIHLLIPWLEHPPLYPTMALLKYAEAS